jgi:hypothetical protein
MPNLMMPDTPAKTADMPWNPHALSPSGPPGGFFGGPGGVGGGAAFAPGYGTPTRGSFGGQAGTGGPGSGSLFPVAEAGNTGELYGAPAGLGGVAEAGNTGELYGAPAGLGGSSGVLGSSHMGGFGSVGSGLRIGATSPAFGKPLRDRPGPSGPALAAGSGLYSTTPLRNDSPAPGGGMPGNAQGVRGVGGLPPMYAGSAGLSSSGSAGNLFAGGQGRSGSDGGSVNGNDGGHP